MAGFGGGAQIPHSQANDTISARGTRYGRVLFAIYLLLYGGYVGIIAFAPAIMKRTPLAGISLSVLYGLGLIVAAFLMALLYDWLCRPAAAPPHATLADAPAGEHR